MQRGLRALGRGQWAAGRAAYLMEQGWLPRHAAADALDCSPAELDLFVRDGAVARRSIGNGLHLYRVPRGRA